ncbi:sensor domain-containing protein [Haloarcula sediminis]|uniref:sensor domain-containing protein n=1 Tax=Haloarcula sediminis TaxID=3111777 RepID=UPI002D79804F|nr:sensor domain-containing protein [Haloarcula sp. CK38]
MPSLRSACTAPVRLRTYRHLLYLALVLPLGLLYFNVLLTGLSVAIPLSALVVGVPILLLTLLVARGFAAAERRLTASLLGADLADPSYPFLDGGPRERAKALLFDGTTWRECLYLFLLFPVGVVAFTSLVTGLTVALTLLVTPFVYDTPGVRVGVFPEGSVTISQSLTVPWGDLLVGVGVVTTVSEWAVDSLADALLFSLLGVAVLVVTLNLANAAAWLLARVAERLLDDRGATRDGSETA